MKYDVVLFGHTHEVVNEERNGVLALNPGSAHGFEKRGTIAILDTASRKANVLEIT